MSSAKLFRKDEVDGKTVVETTGNTFGNAKDVAFGLDGTVALIVLDKDNNEVQVTMDRVLGVGDYIVIRKEKLESKPPTPPAPQPVVTPPPAPPVPPAAPATPMAPPPTVMAPMVCKSCGAALKPGARFCTKCGTAV